MKNNKTLQYILIGVALLVLPLILQSFGNAWVRIADMALLYILLAIGLNIVVGYAGLLDLGYVAFFAVGAYMYGLLSSPHLTTTFEWIALNFPNGLHLPIWLIVPLGAALAGIFGMLLGAPTLKLRGDYLAIVTLGFGEIVPIVLLNSDPFTGGTNGLGGVDKPVIPGILEFTLINPWPFYVLMMVMIALIMIVVFRLQDSRIGRAWDAVREDELAAESSGVNTVISKLQAFAVGAAIAGFVGVFNAAKLTIVAPDQFKFVVSISAVAAVVLGGMGNPVGVAVGAFVIYLVQSIFLKQLNTLVDNFNIPVLQEIDFLEFQYVLYGIVLVLMMLKRPQGIFPAKRRLRIFKDSVGADK